MTNVKRLYNNTLYRVELDVTERFVLYIQAPTLRSLDNEVNAVVNDDVYRMATDQKPYVISYTYEPHYVTCDESFEEFVNEQDNDN